MPGLVRGVARTAVVAGTATAVSGRVQRRQAARFAAPDAASSVAPSAAYEETRYAPPPPSPAPSEPDPVSQLERLGALKTQGLLTDDEFAAQKAKILGL
jgi:hypothetical protein